MSSGTRFWVARGGELLAAVLLLALIDDRDASVSFVTAGTVGVLVGLGLVPVALRVRAPVPLARLGLAIPAGIYLTLRAAVEEVVWRFALTGRVAGAAGWPLGLTVGSLGFALSHASAGRTAILVHTLTGLAFGSVYLATGSLIAPVVAHALYNVLLLATSVRASV